MNETLLQLSWDRATQRTQSWIVRIEHAQDGLLAEGELTIAHGLIGSSEVCEITLTDETIPEIVGCFQIIEGQLLIVIFESMQYHWLTPETPWKFGLFKLKLVQLASRQPSLSILHSNPILAPVPTTTAQACSWKFLSGKSQGTTRRMNRRMAFFGTSERCQFRLDAPSPAKLISGYFLQTAAGVWLVALDSTFPIQVNEQAVALTPLTHQDIVEIGTLRLQCLLSENEMPTLNPEDPIEPSDQEDIVHLWNSEEPVHPSIMDMLKQFSSMQSEMFEQFRQSLAGLAATVGQVHREQISAMQEELARLVEMNRHLLTMHVQPHGASAPVPNPPLPKPQPKVLPAAPEPSAFHSPQPKAADDAETAPPRMAFDMTPDWLLERLAIGAPEPKKSVWKRVGKFFTGN